MTCRRWRRRQETSYGGALRHNANVARSPLRQPRLPWHAVAHGLRHRIGKARGPRLARSMPQPGRREGAIEQPSPAVRQQPDRANSHRPSRLSRPRHLARIASGSAAVLAVVGRGIGRDGPRRCVMRVDSSPQFPGAQYGPLPSSVQISPTLLQNPKQRPLQPSAAPHRLPSQLGTHPHGGQYKLSPQPSSTRPHWPSHDVSGMHTHWLLWHAYPLAQEPHPSVPPQPSLIVPHCAPAFAHVCLTHVHAAWQAVYALSQVLMRIGSPLSRHA
jgi:hypothetical protein